MMEDVEPIPITSGANLGRTCSNLRPPAVVTEFMSQGSVKSALARKSEVVVGNMHRVVVAMDAAKVRMQPPAPCNTWSVPHCWRSPFWLWSHNRILNLTCCHHATQQLLSVDARHVRKIVSVSTLTTMGL